MDLPRRAFGLKLGLMLGLTFLLGYFWLLFIYSQGEFFLKFSSFFFGYTFFSLGAIIGFFWAFVYGFFFGDFLAWLYNTISIMIYVNKSPYVWIEFKQNSLCETWWLCAFVA